MPSGNPMRSRLVRIGNSRGIRLPKLVIEEAGFSDEVEIEVRPGALIITPVAAQRAGWAHAARRQASRGEDLLVAEPGPTAFDEEEWDW